MRLAVLAMLALAAPAVAQPKQLPPHLVAPTNALSPADERKAFTLPEGFDAQLVASEPDIQKPMQMAFDAKGRMWVTTSYHYPFAAEKGKAKDKLFILSDINPETGKAGKVQVFADDLNIPIGILPLPDCKSCIVSSVGEIRKYTDTDGDGKGDKMEVLFTGFGSRDTHGMYNSYTLMPDGWVYACHGFANDSTVKGKDGHEVKMQSGHTFRFKTDGSRLEVVSRGQVNPFGMTVDPWFNLYTADCHSKPITQIIPGAYYDSFGKPHDGLGFAPHVTAHPHKSTGLCGLAWYDADQFPKEYKGMMFLGDVVSNCISLDKIEWKGASPVAKEMPDFLTSKDRWFRPVDIKLGPDGTLYVADFYNKIIGHYEVDLKHPGRDHDHGRIWRIVWKGKDGKAPAPKFHRADFTSVEDNDLAEDLFHPNIAVRFLAGHQLRRRALEGKKLAANGTLPKRCEENPDRATAAMAWAISIAEATKLPLRGEDYGLLLKRMNDVAKTPEQRTGHLIRVMSSRATWGVGERNILLAVLRSFDSPHESRAAVEAAISHPHADFVQPLVELLKKTEAADTHLRQAAKIALRNCLRDANGWPENYDAVYADIALAIPSDKAATYLLSQITAKKVTDDKLPAAAEHVARYGAADQQEKLVEQLLKSAASPLNADAILGAFKGVQARGVKLGPKSVERVLTETQDAIRRGASSSDPPTAEETKGIAAALRVLNALPAVAPRASNPNDRLLNTMTTDRLEGIIGEAKSANELRVAAAEVLLRYGPVNGLKFIRKHIAEPTTPDAVRAGLLLVFAGSDNKEARLDARDALKDAPYRTTVAVGVALASTPFGAQDLLDAVKMGKAPARLLQEQAILERLRAAKIADLDKQVAALTKGLPPLDARLAALIKQRSAAFASAKPDKELGAKLFTKHCAACHKIGDMGGKIAPQLDGIGNRGLERLLEDTLDPNRNVDQAFRARIILTKDEKTTTGLMLRVEGEVLVVADAEGKEIRIPTKDIASNRETMLSPMPANVGDIIPEAEFMHLIAYLLDQKAKEPPKNEK